ncbi:transposase [Rhodococcus sp. ARC_M8]|uniref:transposase n=1 Tax=Rhodococcus sp. ARC_M8 TaxID=2928853 RepID=UPI001FB372AA|nr:transposase [Rhodococcus sp. ARC_M8]MCJ0949995.1 transposase [Rhodococcus sp. ARC_M8]
MGGGVMMGRRRYSEDFRTRCLAMVEELLAERGSSREEVVVAVATAMGMPVTTLRNWVREERGPARAGVVPADSELVVRQLEQKVRDLVLANRHLNELAGS